MLVLLDEPYARVIYYADNNTLELQWRGVVRTGQFRGTLDFALQCAKNNHCMHWLFNNRHMAPIAEVDQDWMSDTWLHRLTTEVLLVKMAIIVSTDVFNRLDVQNIIGRATPAIRFPTQFFHTTDLAWEWIRGTQGQLSGSPMSSHYR